MPRKNFTAAVKVAAYKRSQGLCEQCGATLRPGKFAYDHKIADALGGEPILTNCEVLCTEGPDGGCHGRKTRGQDVPAISKAKRREAANLNASTPTRRPLPAGKESDVKLTVDRRLVSREKKPGRQSLKPRPLYK